MMDKDPIKHERINLDLNKIRRRDDLKLPATFS